MFLSLLAVFVVLSFLFLNIAHLFGHRQLHLTSILLIEFSTPLNFFVVVMYCVIWIIVEKSVVFACCTKFNQTHSIHCMIPSLDCMCLPGILVLQQVYTHSLFILLFAVLASFSTVLCLVQSIFGRYHMCSC